MDTIADTSCVGLNWSVVEWTRNTCYIYPYMEGYAAVKDVLVATWANGMDFILIAHEMLYFGKEMGRSLLNQNQNLGLHMTQKWPGHGQLYKNG